FRRAIQARGDAETLAVARSGLAMTLLARGQTDAARAEATALATGAPASAPAQLTLALVEFRRGDLAAADAALGRALAADSQNGQAHAWRSYVLRARNDL